MKLHDLRQFALELPPLMVGDDPRPAALPGHLLADHPADEVLVRPIFHKTCPRCKILSQLLQSHGLAVVVSNQLVLDPLHLAAEPEVGPVPASQGDTLVRVYGALTLEVEEWKILDPLHLYIRNVTGSSNPHEPTQVLVSGLLDYHFLVAKIQELVELIHVVHLHYQVLDGEALFPKLAVCMLGVDLVH